MFHPQVLELGRWRSVCTNSRNWTQADMEVACKQLGFTGGEWYFWHLHLNDTVQILYEEPGNKNTKKYVVKKIVRITLVIVR